MPTRTIAATGGPWGTNTTWVELAVPTAADDVVANAASGALTINVAAACRSIDLSAYTSTLTHNTSITLTVGDASGGALNFTGAWTYTRASATTSAVTFASTSNNGGAGWAVTAGGKTFSNVQFNGAGGKWVLQDAFATTTTASFAPLQGTLDTNNQAVSAGSFVSSGSLTRAITLGTSTINLQLTTASAVINMTATGLTFSGASSAWVIASASVNTRTLAMAGLTYGTLTYIVAASTGIIVITGSNTFDTINVSGGARTLRLTHGTTTTVTTFNVFGTAGNLVTLDSSTAGSTTTQLTKAGGGTAVSAYISVKDINGNPGTTWYADPGGVDAGNNQDWTFGPPPVVHALAGSTAGASTAAGDLTVTGATHALAGSSAGASGTAGSLTVAISLAGTSAGVSTAQGSTNLTIPLNGSSTGVSATTGALDVSSGSVVHELAGTTGGVSSAAGSLSMQWALVGATGTGPTDWPVTTPTKAVAGVVRDAGGTPYAGATVKLIRESDGFLCQTTTSAGDGTYSFARDAFDPHTYYVVAFEDTGTPTQGISARALVPV